jgi:hypothetical protein
MASAEKWDITGMKTRTQRGIPIDYQPTFQGIWRGQPRTGGARAIAG